MTEENLEPCPFCGGEAQLMFPELDWESKAGTVMCMTCFASSQGNEDWKVAVADWNERNSPVVKPLSWEEPCKENNWLHIARTEFGDYGIHICGGRHQAWLEAHKKPYERWLGDGYVGSVFDAKAQAEEYHEKMVREWFL